MKSIPAEIDVEAKADPRGLAASWGATLAVAAALGMVAVAVLLWSGQGAEIFLAQAFAALAACF